MKSRKTKKAPHMPGMIEVNGHNRKSLERKYGFEIPAEVDYILPPDTLLNLMNDPEFWEEHDDKGSK